MNKFELATQAHESMSDITAQVRRAIADSGVREGICTVYCPHTTAGITINENADPDVVHDLLGAMAKLVPWEAGYRHAEGNSAAHVKSTLVGASASVLVDDGQPVLGTWQSVFFCEFDGPRQRKFLVKTLSA